MSPSGKDADRSRAPGRRTLAAGLSASVAVHAVLVALVSFPRPEAREASPGPEAFRHVDLPPRVRVPPSPAPIPRPPAPKAREVDVDEPVRAAARPVPAPPAGPAPRPPSVSPVSFDDRPSLADADVPPLMEAPDELRERLRRGYPERLRRLERGGVVELRFFIDESGDVEQVDVRESSGYPRLDRTAVEMTREATFLPALIRDRPVGVWVRQRICFVFVEERDEKPSPEECERRVALRG